MTCVVGRVVVERVSNGHQEMLVVWLILLEHMRFVGCRCLRRVVRPGCMSNHQRRGSMSWEGSRLIVVIGGKEFRFGLI